ncbi:MAG TPA: hypothetical protein VK724_26360 [Bryobacteraceae bacterium]|nr:hypothetical protein [Bryobacteraceae bacterium]
MKKLTTNKEAEIFGFQIAAIVIGSMIRKPKISTAKPSMRRIELSETGCQSLQERNHSPRNPGHEYSRQAIV